MTKDITPLEFSDANECLSSLASIALKEINKRVMSVTSDGTEKYLSTAFRQRIYFHIKNLISNTMFIKNKGETAGVNNIISRETQECCLNVRRQNILDTFN